MLGFVLVFEVVSYGDGLVFEVGGGPRVVVSTAAFHAY